MGDNSSSSSSGIGVFGLLGVAFVVLKLVGVIDWSWWWVTAPFWGGIVLFIIIAVIYLTYSYNKSRKARKYLRDLKKPESRFQKRLREMQEQRE